MVEIARDLRVLIRTWKPQLAVVEKFFFYRSSTTARPGVLYGGPLGLVVVLVVVLVGEAAGLVLNWQLCRRLLQTPASRRLLVLLRLALMPMNLVFWRNRSTSTVVPAASASQARSRGRTKQKRGYGAIVAARRANAQEAGLIRKGTWVRRRRDGSSPQFGSATAIGCDRASAAALDDPNGLQCLHRLGGHGGGKPEPAWVMADLFCLSQGAKVALDPPTGNLLGQLAPLGCADAR